MQSLFQSQWPTAQLFTEYLEKHTGPLIERLWAEDHYDFTSLFENFERDLLPFPERMHELDEFIHHLCASDEPRYWECLLVDNVLVFVKSGSAVSQKMRRNDNSDRTWLLKDFRLCPTSKAVCKMVDVPNAVYCNDCKNERQKIVQALLLQYPKDDLLKFILSYIN